MKMDNNKCNFSTCLHNKGGICQSENDRKVCVEVSKTVLYLECTEKKEREQMNATRKEIIYRYAILSDIGIDCIKRKFPHIDVLDNLQDESVYRLFEQLEEKGIEKEFLQALMEFE